MFAGQEHPSDSDGGELKLPEQLAGRRDSISSLDSTVSSNVNVSQADHPEQYEVIKQQKDIIEHGIELWALFLCLVNICFIAYLMSAFINRTLPECVRFPFCSYLDKTSIDLFLSSFPRFNKKPKRGVQYLQDQGMLGSTAEDIAQFLHQEDRLDTVSDYTRFNRTMLFSQVSHPPTSFSSASTDPGGRVPGREY